MPSPQNWAAERYRFRMLVLGLRPGKRPLARAFIRTRNTSGGITVARILPPKLGMK